MERILGIFSVFTLLVAWFLGLARARAGIEPLLGQLLPSAGHFEKIETDMFSAYAPGEDGELIGYVTVGEAAGYGGPMKVAVAVNPQGEVLGLAIIEHKETPSWYDRILNTDFIQSLVGKSFQDAFALGEDVDGISGATYTTRAIAEATLRGSRRVASEVLKLPVPREPATSIQFGIPEITLLALFIFGVIGHQRNFKYKKQVRWLSMLTGLIVLGVIYTQPLTISDISRLLIGFWPQWQTNLYWYILLGGILFMFTVENKNPYCEWFCPFGAAQECLGTIGGAKPRSAGKYYLFLKWLQRGMAWLALLLALLFRNPGLTSYEVFGTLFDLKGTSLQFLILGIILVASLFIRRPWCAYLCPLKPVTDLIRTIRSWVISTWKTRKEQPKTSAQ
jgi:NosR/NirI family nitrous oxide reductase transcriptional regulator